MCQTENVPSGGLDWKSNWRKRVIAGQDKREETSVQKARKQMILKAINYNWNMAGPGDWENSTWHVYEDGSYILRSVFRPSSAAYEDSIITKKEPKSTILKISGIMDEAAYIKLKEAIKREPWREPSINHDACDGEAWKITSYKEDGSIEKSSGEIGYIYGNCVLENITRLLPYYGNRYIKDAFQKQI